MVSEQRTAFGNENDKALLRKSPTGAGAGACRLVFSPDRPASPFRLKLQSKKQKKVK